MSFDLPPPSQPLTSPSNFADSRWSREVSEDQTLHTKFQLPTTILGMSIQQNPLLSTQMTSGLYYTQCLFICQCLHSSREPCIEDPDYPTIIDWDQPISTAEPDPVSTTIHSAWQEVEAPVARPSWAPTAWEQLAWQFREQPSSIRPPQWQIIVTEGTEVGRRPGDKWPSKDATSTPTVSTKRLPAKEYLNGHHSGNNWSTPLNQNPSLGPGGAE